MVTRTYVPDAGDLVWLTFDPQAGDHVKNLDWDARRVVFEAKAPAEVLTEVRERLRALLEL